MTDLTAPAESRSRNLRRSFWLGRRERRANGDEGPTLRQDRPGSSRRAVHENTHPRGEAASEELHGGQATRGCRSRLLEIDRGGQRRDHRAVRDADVLRVGALGELSRGPKDAIPDAEVRDGRSDAFDLTRELGAQHPLRREPEQARQERWQLPQHDVAAGHRGDVDPHEYVAACRHGQRDVGENQLDRSHRGERTMGAGVPGPNDGLHSLP